jgi:hypothetical protein
MIEYLLDSFDHIVDMPTVAGNNGFLHGLNTLHNLSMLFTDILQFLYFFIAHIGEGAFNKVLYLLLLQIQAGGDRLGIFGWSRDIFRGRALGGCFGFILKFILGFVLSVFMLLRGFFMKFYGFSTFFLLLVEVEDLHLGNVFMNLRLVNFLVKFL